MRKKIFPYLQSLLDKNLPFLALKKANQNVVQIISQNNQIWHKAAHDNLSYAVFSKFENIENQVYILNEKELIFKWSNAGAPLSKLRNTLPEKGKKEYMKLFEKAISKLKNSSLEKVVLSRTQEFPKPDSDVEIFERLLDSYPTANGYFFYHPQVGKWMGATPELLLEVSKELTHQAYSANVPVPVQVYTMSLAGTALNDGSGTHNWGDKEKEEQQLVTDFIKTQFEKIGVTDLQESEVQTVTAGHLLHLRTLIAGKTQLSRIDKLLGALHPTPAVCGLPRDASKEFILVNENYDRSYYTGYLGVVNKNSRNYYVNLRCMQLLKETAVIYVGGGVTAKSDGELEYQETMAKLNTMYKLL